MFDPVIISWLYVFVLSCIFVKHAVTVVVKGAMKIKFTYLITQNSTVLYLYSDPYTWIYIC